MHGSVWLSNQSSFHVSSHLFEFPLISLSCPVHPGSELLFSPTYLGQGSMLSSSTESLPLTQPTQSLCRSHGSYLLSLVSVPGANL